MILDFLIKIYVNLSQKWSESLTKRLTDRIIFSDFNWDSTFTYKFLSLPFSAANRARKVFRKSSFAQSIENLLDILICSLIGFSAPVPSEALFVLTVFTVILYLLFGRGELSLSHVDMFVILFTFFTLALSAVTGDSPKALESVLVYSLGLMFYIVVKNKAKEDHSTYSISALYVLSGAQASFLNILSPDPANNAGSVYILCLPIALDLAMKSGGVKKKALYIALICVILFSFIRYSDGIIIICALSYIFIRIIDDWRFNLSGISALLLIPLLVPNKYNVNIKEISAASSPEYLSIPTSSGSILEFFLHSLSGYGIWLTAVGLTAFAALVIFTLREIYADIKEHVPRFISSLLAIVGSSAGGFLANQMGGLEYFDAAFIFWLFLAIIGSKGDLNEKI